MNKSFLSLIVAITFTACTNTNKNSTQTAEGADTALVAKSETEAEPETKGGFDINSIPVSTVELGDFPFFNLPEGLEPQNKPVLRKYDKLFFPIAGVMTPIEGKVWKSNITNSKNEEWSLPYFEKSYDDAIKNIGGVKIFDAKVSNEEMDRIKDQATYFGEEGSIDYWNDPVKVYVVHRENKDDIYIQLSGNSAAGYLQILQKEPFKQTITLMKSTQIKTDLEKNGKAVLHINFDTDKASLKPDGKLAVAEIVKVMDEDKGLVLAINGYTDNAGSDDHNLQLSVKRAETVKNELIAAGIDQQRLSSAGFGSKRPIADNATEEGKTQNRRVELVKK